MAKKKATRKKAGRKKAAKKRAPRKPKPPAIQPAELDRLILVLASGASVHAATQIAIEKCSLSPAVAAVHVEEAAKRIALAASVDRMTELGTAYTRLNLLFQSSLNQGENGVALSAQRELNKLLSLYRTPDDGPDPEETHSADLDAVRQHLEPLDLAAAGTPVEELARIAALTIMGADF
jgi:hypothetical protein